MIAVAVADITILIRCCYRVAELSGGFNGALANNQTTFMVLEGAMIAIAVLALTVGHPGPAFGSMWQTAGFHLRKSKGEKLQLASPVADLTEGKAMGNHDRSPQYSV